MFQIIIELINEDFVLPDARTESEVIADGSDTDGLIAEVLVTAGFKVVSLVAEELKLDDAFLRLTRGAVN